MKRRDDAAHPTAITGKAVIRFSVVSGVGKNRSDGDSAQRGKQQLAERVEVHHRPDCRKGAQDQMTGAIADDLQFRECAIRHHFRDFGGTFPAFNEVATGA
jgi:hypothetical protein